MKTPNRLITRTTFLLTCLVAATDIGCWLLDIHFFQIVAIAIRPDRPRALGRSLHDGTDTMTLTVTQAPDTKKFARLKVVITP